MKKVYLFGALLLSGLTVIGQSNITPYDFGMVKSKVIENQNPEENNFRPNTDLQSGDRALNILWTEDFSGTTALTTSNGTWTVSGSEGAYWELTTSTNSPLGYANYLSGRHLLWDSYTPVSAVEPSGSFASTLVEGSVMTPTIDLTGYTNATLEFDLNGRYCCNDEPWTVSVSNNDGVTWGTEIPLNLGLDDNVTSSDIAQPVTFSVNISPYLDAVGANNNDVKLRFTWTGIDANGAGQTSSYYSWEIDDILIYEIPQFEISQEQLWMQDLNVDYEYTNFPTSQVGILTVQAELENNGINEPTNIAMEVTVFDASNNTIIAGPMSGGSLANAPFLGGEQDTITFTTTVDLSTYAIGEYTVRATITYDETDDIPDNDMLMRTFRVSNTTLGHVNYDANPITVWNSFSTSDTKVGARFTIAEDEYLHGADFYIEEEGGTSASTTMDVPFAIWIHQYNEADDLFEEIAYYSYEALTSDMVDGWNTFNFHQADPDNSDPSAPLLLEADNTYIVTFESLDPYWYRASLADPDFSGAIYFGADDQWFWTGNDPYVMLNFDQSLDVNDNVINPSAFVSQNKPNPFTDNTVITYSLNEVSNVTLEILDVTGKVVASINEGAKNAGQHTVTVSGDKLSDGVYFYNFKAGNYSVTKRMVVNK